MCIRDRRMLSNRESARRSRLRKQTHLSELEGHMGSLREENNDLTAKLEQAGAHLVREQQQNEALKAEMAKLQEALAARK